MSKSVVAMGAFGALLVMLAALYSPAGAAGQTVPVQTVSITPARDNTLYQTTGDALSNGRGIHIFAGVTNQTADNNKRRAVLAFDIADALPAGAEIVDVELALTLSKSLTGASQVTVHRLTDAWGEGSSDASGPEGKGAPATAGDATWLHTFFDGGIWTKPGGEYISSPSARATVGDTNATVTWGSNRQLIADVSLWLDRPLENHGWILIGDESTTGTAKRFNSREHPTESSRPRLTIGYRPPPERNQLYLPILYSP